MKNKKVKNNEPNGSIDKDKKNTDNVNEPKMKYVETLFNVNLSIERGKLVGICGSVGAGKSSLLSAVCSDVSLQIYLLFLHLFINKPH